MWSAPSGPGSAFCTRITPATPCAPERRDRNRRASVLGFIPFRVGLQRAGIHWPGMGPHMGQCGGHTGQMTTVIGANIRHRRKQRGWTQARLAWELCRAAGVQGEPVSTQEITRWEAGRRTPRDWLPFLAAVLGVSVEVLTGPPVPPEAAMLSLAGYLPEGDPLAPLSARNGRRIGEGVVRDLHQRVHGLRRADDVVYGLDLIGRAMLTAIPVRTERAGWPPPVRADSACHPWSDLGNLQAVGHVVGHATALESKKPHMKWGPCWWVFDITGWPVLMTLSGGGLHRLSAGACTRVCPVGSFPGWGGQEGCRTVCRCLWGRLLVRWRAADLLRAGRGCAMAVPSRASLECVRGHLL
ncbi:helix-turn-helix transcriptional regulator, partial [Streptomyces clavuligerus]